jgi:hypothetical protein
MKIFRLIVPLFVLGLTMVLAPEMKAQEPDTTHSVNMADSLGSTLLNEYEKDFDVVFKAVKKGLEDEGYVVNYASKKRNLIETEFRILAGEDDFDEQMEKYGDVPYIRSPGWTVGRTKLTVEFERLENGKTGVKVQALMSGFEARFTNQWHYWRSNGRLEQSAMDAINAAVEGSNTP